MLPEYLIYDELKRERERSNDWQPDALQLPLYHPEYGSVPDDKERQESDLEPSRGVIIIDMNNGNDFSI